MYKFPRNIKIICFCLMAIGILSIAYGFIVADKNQYTDLEIRLAVKDMYNEYKSNKKLKFEQGNSDSKDSYKKTYDSHHDSDQENYHYSKLFDKIEKRFNCKLDIDKKKNAHGVEDIIYITQHYFHVKKQRPWSNLFL